MKTARIKLSPQLTFGEELANSVTHGVGALAMLVLLPFTAVHGLTRYGLTASVSFSIFVISLFLMFLSSSIYHAMTYDTVQKRVLRVIDHSMIYIAIAGSYTPVALCLVGGRLGLTILLLQWGITLYGILYKSLARRINDKFSLALYLIMGWLVVLILPAILKQTSASFGLLMLAGGLCYSLGAVFYARKRPYDHMIWHLFILLASALQYVAIVFFML